MSINFQKRQRSKREKKDKIERTNREHRRGINASKYIFENTTAWCSKKRNSGGLEICEKKILSLICH